MEIKHSTASRVAAAGFRYLADRGVEEKSRNGPVIVAPGPVTSIYTRPLQRVLFSPLRDANPWFHLLGDALWCLAGRHDIAWPVYFNSKYAAYSDDGTTQWGAYGRRWRSWFGYDQLQAVVKELQVNSGSRRAVLTMWSANSYPALPDDLRRAYSGGVDVPCNTHIYFDVRDKQLNMTVCCRSNDALWGAYGANVVVFSMLQEYIAAALKVVPGEYRQFSNNFHVYPANLPALDDDEASPRERLLALASDLEYNDYYTREGSPVRPFALVNTSIAQWNLDLDKFLSNPLRPQGDFEDTFFTSVAGPMYRAWRERKERKGDGLDWARLIGAEDWRRACIEWILRRERRKKEEAK